MYFRVDMTPIGKARARTVTGRDGSVHSYTPQSTAKAEMLIRSAANREGDSFPAGTPLDMIIVAWFHRPKSAPKSRIFPVVKPDLDNVVKLVIDALSGVVYPDDNQICRFEAFKAYCKDGDIPHIDVWIFELKTEG